MPKPSYQFIADMLDISVRTVESWRQGRRKPSPLMKAYLTSRDHDCGTPTGDGCEYCQMLHELNIMP